MKKMEQNRCLLPITSSSMKSFHLCALSRKWSYIFWSIYAKPKMELHIRVDDSSFSKLPVRIIQFFFWGESDLCFDPTCNCSTKLGSQWSSVLSDFAQASDFHRAVLTCVQQDTRGPGDLPREKFSTSCGRNPTFLKVWHQIFSQRKRPKLSTCVKKPSVGRTLQARARTTFDQFSSFEMIKMWYKSCHISPVLFEQVTPG